VNRPDPPLTDGVIRLREFRAGDAPAVARACADPVIARFIPRMPVPYTIEDADAYVAHSVDDQDVHLAISPADGDELLGAIGLTIIEADTAAADTGYWIVPEHRGKGVATGALRLFSRWAIPELGLARLQLQTLADNAASQTVARRAGFTREAVLRDYMDDRGSARDSVMFSLVPADL
jgi:RimJ/RimL family protein N-acetyltransferase